MSGRKLPDWITYYLEYVDNSEPAESFKLWTAISTIAACLKRKCRLEWGMLTFYPNLYVVLVGPSGCRKGTAMGPGYQMLCDLNIRMSAEATTRESLIRELNRSSDTNADPITGKMEFHSSLTIFSQELSVFLGYNNMQLMSDLTDWYDCRARWKYSTKDAKLSDDIINVWVNLFGATTPSLIQSVMPPDAIGLGLTSRMIFIFEPGKGKSCPAPFLTDVQKELRPMLMADLERISMLNGKFYYTKEFMDYYITWYEAQEDHPPFTDDRLSGYMERRPNHLLKLCMVMCASRTDSMQLNHEDLLRALTILEEAEKNMPQVFGGVGKSKYASMSDRVIKLLAVRKIMLFSELLKRFSHDIDSRGMEDVIKNLEQMKIVRITTMGKEKKIEFNTESLEPSDGNKADV